MWMLSCLCLAVVIFCCIAGVLFPPYRDNLLQRIGMAVLAFGSASRFQHVWRTEHVGNDWLLVHCGMALIAVGTTLKLQALARERSKVDTALHILEVSVRSAKNELADVATPWSAVMAGVERRCIDLRRAISHRNTVS